MPQGSLVKGGHVKGVNLRADAAAGSLAPPADRARALGLRDSRLAVWREAASSFAEVKGDALGSSVARVPGTGGGPTLAVLGHIDEIGLMVTHADENGFLSFLTVGGWRAEVLLGQRVELLTREGPVPGVVGRKWRRPPKRGEELPRIELEDLFLDIGATRVTRRWHSCRSATPR